MWVSVATASAEAQDESLRSVRMIPDPYTEPTITVPRASQVLGLSRAAAERGEIPIIRFGRRMVVPTARLLARLGLGGGAA